MIFKYTVNDSALTFLGNVSDLGISGQYKSFKDYYTQITANGNKPLGFITRFSTESLMILVLFVNHVYRYYYSTRVCFNDVVAQYKILWNRNNVASFFVSCCLQTRIKALSFAFAIIVITLQLCTRTYLSEKVH